MLLHEIQNQQRINAAQAEQLRDVQKQMVEMRAMLLKLHAKDELVAQR
jgi:hypothetical protein